MTFRGKLLGMEKVLKRMGQMPDKVKPEVTQALVAAGFRVQRTAKRSIQNSPADPDTGRSKPGNPPKTDTGRLVNSIFVHLEEYKDRSVVFIGTTVFYGRELEFGTTKILARPWLQPAIEANRKENVRALAEAWKKAMKAA